MSDKMIEVERTGFLKLKMADGEIVDLTEEQSRDLYFKLKTALGIYEYQVWSPPYQPVISTPLPLPCNDPWVTTLTTDSTGPS